MFRTAQIIILGVIALFVLFFVTRPLLADIRVVQEEASNYRTAVEKATEFNQLLQQTKARQESISALERDRLNALLPNEVNLVRTLVNIEALANANGMVVESASAAQGEAEGADATQLATPLFGVSGVSSEEVTVEVLGVYSQFTTFLAELEQSVPLIEINTLSFELTEGDLTRYALTLYLPKWSPETTLDPVETEGMEMEPEL